MGFFIGFVYLIPDLFSYLINRFADDSQEPLRAAALLLCALFSVVVPYLLGSINPAILISRLVYHEDIRNFGSGNAGTTNMLRTYGKKAAAATFLIDLSKGAVAVVLGALVFGRWGIPLAGFFVIFGHMFPIFAHFKGGKGVACLTVVVLVISPITFLILLGMFLIIVIGTRYISLGSVMCAMLYPLILRAFVGNTIPEAIACAVLSACFVIFMHRENLKRLWHGKEHKINFSKLSKQKIDDGEKPDGGTQNG